MISPAKSAEIGVPPTPKTEGGGVASVFSREEAHNTVASLVSEAMSSLYLCIGLEAFVVVLFEIDKS